VGSPEYYVCSRIHLSTLLSIYFTGVQQRFISRETKSTVHNDSSNEDGLSDLSELSDEDKAMNGSDKGDASSDEDLEIHHEFRTLGSFIAQLPDPAQCLNALNLPGSREGPVGIVDAEWVTLLTICSASHYASL
jgi:hypothetical protein